MKDEMTEENTIITSDKIQDILSNYKIGKKPLARLLGWGETTIIRYMDGDVPTVEYSDKLLAIYNSPSYYYKILIRNKTKLTNVAFRKSKRAVLDCMLESRINVIAQYIINLQDGQISQSNLQSLLYYVQGFHLGFFGTPIFDNECALTEKDMPYISFLNQTNESEYIYLELGDELLTDKEKELVESVVEAFGWYGQKSISAMISLEKALLKVSRDKDNNKVIGIETMKSYFKEVLADFKIRRLGDIGKYPDSKFVELKN